MAVEIERKFLVTGDGWRDGVIRRETVRQGYLNTPERCSVRVRLRDGEAFLNIKEAVTGRERLEFDYPIPFGDAQQMLARLAVGPQIEKTRHVVEDAGVVWEVDVFEGDNAGLVVAEIELPRADAEVPRPAWLGREVTQERRYYNVSLSERPYSTWSEAERKP